jgi:hypothetical protein
MTRAARVGRLVHLSAAPAADTRAGQGGHIGDVPTIRWDDPDAVTVLTFDWEMLTEHTADPEAFDWATADGLADAASDAARRVTSLSRWIVRILSCGEPGSR